MAKEERYETFGRAARDGDLQTIRRMLTGENPVPVDCLSPLCPSMDHVKCTALVIACQEGHLAVAKELIQSGAKVIPNHLLYTPLHAACEYGKSPELVEILLAAGADVNIKAAFGSTPLTNILFCRAITMAQRKAIARLLLAAECDVKQETKDTALAWACTRCHDDELIRFLIEHGAMISREAFSSCLDNWIGSDPPIVKIRCLLELGMNINAKDDYGDTALHKAAEKISLDVVRLLLDHNADVSIQSRIGDTALMQAIRIRIDAVRLGKSDDQILLVCMLLEQMNTIDNKLIDLTHTDGSTALHLAAELSSSQVIHELLNWKPNLLCQAGDASSTALHSCVGSLWHESVLLRNVRCLVEHANGYGLDGINIQDGQGRTVLHVALRYADSNRSVIDYLSTKVDVSIQDVEGNMPLHIVVQCNHSKVLVQMLLHSRHATEAANTLNGHGRTPLHEAVLRKNANLVQAIGQKADVNIRSGSQKTALHFAVIERATTCLDLLLMFNANVTLRDNDNNTALMLACLIDDDAEHSKLTMIFQLYKRGIAYGEVLNMI